MRAIRRELLQDTALEIRSLIVILLVLMQAREMDTALEHQPDSVEVVDMAIVAPILIHETNQ